MVRMTPTQLDAYQLMHDGALALADVEANGMRIDTDYLTQTKKEVTEKIKKLEQSIRETDVYKALRKRFGQRVKLTSPKQLARVLQEDFNKTLAVSSKGNDVLDEDALTSLNMPYCDSLLDIKRLRNLLTKYLEGVENEVVDGFIHSVFNLHLARTFRSSSDSFNFQNIPVRNKMISKLIRSAFVPRSDEYVLIEIDYGAQEFKVAACFWKDPDLLSYASDPSKDIHRDCAAEAFMLSKDQVTKDARYCGKNMVVFPELFGDFYLNCAKSMWNAIEKMNLKTVDGVPMYDHLAANGITSLGALDTKKKTQFGTFEHHIKQVEKTFYEWFPVLAERQDEWWNRYLQVGGFPLMSGFWIDGIYSRNFLFNCPVQGPAFHLLLWSLIRLVRWTQKHKTKTKIVGQIHDSIIADVHRSELHDYLALAKEVMTTKATAANPWVTVPLLVEAELCEENWYDKKPILFEDYV